MGIKDPSFLHAYSEDFGHIGRMPRLIWVFAGRTAILLVLSCRGTYTIVFTLFLQYLVPDKDTTYLCTGFQLPDFGGKHHIVGVRVSNMRNIN